VVALPPCSRPTKTPTSSKAGRSLANQPAWRSPKLLRHLAGLPGLDAALQDTGRDSYVLSGEPVTDAEALAQTDIPGHERCVEVGKLREGDVHGAATG
jgi:hypothetical protein